MARHRSTKKTYTKVVPTPVEQTTRHTRHRKIVPKFSDNFLEKDENACPNKSNSLFDSLCKTVKKTESAAGVGDHTLRRPLTRSTFLTNSSLESAASLSLYDTFDRIAKSHTQPKAKRVLDVSSSTSCSSLDATGVLYKSLLSSDSRLAVTTKLEDTGIAAEDEGGRKDGVEFKTKNAGPRTEGGRPNVDGTKLRLRLPAPRVREQAAIVKVNPRSKYQVGYSRRNLRIPSTVQQELSPQLFSSGDECDDCIPDINTRNTKQGRPGRRRSSRDKEMGNIENNTQPCMSRNESNNENCEIEETGVIKIPMQNKVQQSLWIKRFFGALCERASVQDNFSSALSSPVLTDVTPLKSTLSGNLDQLKSSREICTSTPTENSKKQILAQNLRASLSLEDSVSPVPRRQSLMVEEHSPLFESPMYFKPQSKLSSHDYQTFSATGSKYESCMESHRSADINAVSKLKIPLVLSEDESNSDKENIPKSPESFYNSSRKLKSGPFKGVTIPALMLSEHSSCKESPPDEDNLNENQENMSVVVGRKRRAPGVKGKELHRSHLYIKRQALVVLSSPDLHLSSQTRYGSSLLQQSRLSGSLRQVNEDCPENIDVTENNMSVTEQSIIFIRKVIPVNRRRVNAMPDVNFKKLNNITEMHVKHSKPFENQDISNISTCSQVSRRAPAHEDSLTIAGTLTSDTSQFSCNRQSPILTRKQTKGKLKKKTNARLSRDTSGVEDTSTDFVAPSLLPRLGRAQAKVKCYGRVATRKSMRLTEKLFITTRRNNIKRQLNIDMSLSSLNSSGRTIHPVESGDEEVSSRSETSIDGRRKSHIVSFEVNTSQRLRENKSGEMFLDSVLNSNLSNDFDKSIAGRVKSGRRGTSDVENPVTITSQRQSSRRTNSIDASKLNQQDHRQSTYSQRSSRPKGEPISSDPQQSSKADSTLELEEALGPLPPLFGTPAKPGKGWKRSLRSMVALQASFAEPDVDWIRRKTFNHLSVFNRRHTNYRILALPSEIVQQIQQMSRNSRCELSNRTSLQITFLEPGEDPRHRVLSLCSQVAPVPLTDCFSESRLSCCKKIGEGVYGEVFMTRPNPTNMEGATVLKIMPIEGDFAVNGEPQKTFDEIMSEIVISMELSNLRSDDRSKNWSENFVHLLSCWCIQGRYHEDLLQLWDLFNEEKGSENDRPDMFPDSQLYVVLEFGHGGGDLESYVFNNARDSYSAFLQIAYSLAVAEQELEFEHRDLHWGNVLVATTRESSLQFKVNGDTYTLKTRGVKATVIDFTLSRLKTRRCVVYNNLGQDPSLFTAEGDYQFEIYRQMKKANGNEWESFTPYTNVLWLHYLLDKMMTQCYYRNNKAKIHTTHLASMAKVKDSLLDFESATHFVLSRELEAGINYK